MMFSLALSRNKRKTTNVKKSVKLMVVIWRVGVILINRAFVVKRVHFVL
jgi:hypothetical protein